MGMLSNEAKEELKRLVYSSKLKEDLRRISENKHNPFIANGKIDLDRLLTFLTEYNAFINHTPRPFRKIIDKVNKL